MSDTFPKVEVITGVARRRRFSTGLKLALVAETMQPGLSVRTDDAVVAASEVRRLEERVRDWSACSAAKRWKSRARGQTDSARRRICPAAYFHRP